MVVLKNAMRYFLAFAVLLCASQTALAAIEQADPSQLVYDYAELLTEEERTALAEECVQFSADTGLTAAVITIDDAGGLSAREYADGFYDGNGFPDDGLLMLIDMDSRTVWVSTCGAAETEISEGEIEQILDEVFFWLPDGEYAAAGSAFLSAAREAYAPEKTPVPESSEPTSPEEPVPAPLRPSSPQEKGSALGEGLPGMLGFSAVFGLAAGGITLLIMLALHGRSARTTVGRRDYLAGDGLRLTRREDDFLRSYTSRVKIPQNDSPPRGGGGVRSGGFSGGGRSHGGGGRSF